MIILKDEQKKVYDQVITEIKSAAIGAVRAFVPYSCLNTDHTVESAILPVWFYISDLGDFAKISDIIEKYDDLPVISFSVCREEYLTENEKGVFIDI